MALDYDWNYLIENSQYVSMDTETNGKDVFSDKDFRCNGFSLAVKVNGEYIAEYFPIGHKRGTNLEESYWRPIFEKALTKSIIMHNAIFDIAVAESLGIKIINFYDTMKLAHIQNENYAEGGVGYSLDSCTERYLGYAGKEKSLEFNAALAVFGWDRISVNEIREYATADALITYKLFEAILKKLKSEPKVPSHWKNVEAPNLQVLKSMKKLGVRVDVDFAKSMEELGRTQMAKIQEELGFKLEGNGSVKNLKTLLWDELKLPQIINPKTGKPTLDKNAMGRYEDILERQGNTYAQSILAFRGWQKSVSTYYSPYQERISWDGRLRPNYKPHGTVTGRFSCSEPNLQQIPKESDKPWNGRVKECFIPEDGYELYEFDYSQLEFRLSASYAREPKLLDVFNDDSRDIFNEMSADLELPRQDCKTLTYSIQYGAGAQRIMDVFGYSRSEALNLINAWYDNYPGIRRVSDQAKYMGQKDGKVELWTGRYRHFKFPKSESRKAFNSAIQGGAADLVKTTMNNLAKELPELRMLLQVHDSLWFEIPTGKVDYYFPQIKHIMEHPVPVDRVHFKVEGEPVGGLLKAAV